MAKRPSKNKILILLESPGKLAKISSFVKDLPDEYLVRATFGHLLELSKSRAKNLGVDVADEYKIYKVIIPSKKDKLQAIIDAASDCKEILIATDADREGESIGYDAAEMLSSTGLPVYRIKFNEITKPAILKALQNKHKIDYNLVQAAQARQGLDQIVGFLGSPFVKKSFQNDQNMVEAKSAGRVQSVAVRLVIDREEEIRTFEPEEYWNILANLAKQTDLDKKIVAKYVNKVNNKTSADKIKQELESDNFAVTKVEAKEKKRAPFPPLITSTLQITCSNRYNLPIDVTMLAAQGLYESGKITYMRTDSTHVSPEAIEDVRNWLTNNNYNIPSKPNVYNSKSSTDAHECIRPSHVEDHPDNVFFIDLNQKQVYQAIWEKFVCSQMESAIYDTLSIVIKSSSDHELKASGRTLKYPGWLSIATDQISVKSEDEDDITLPNLSSGDDLILIDPKIVANQKWTTPPPRYGEGIFIKELEKRGIGRPSTYSSIVSKIKDRGYVDLKNKVYHGTESGKKVTEKLKRYFKFLDYDYTGNLEEKLDDVASGKLSYVKMMDDFFTTFAAELENAYLDLEGHVKSDIVCHKCKSSLTVICHGQFGFYLYCRDPKCRGSQSCDFVDGKVILKEKVFKKDIYPGINCSKCNGSMTLLTGKWGPFLRCLDDSKIKCMGVSKVPYENRKCNKCGNHLYATVYDKENVLFCMSYKTTGCDFKEVLSSHKIPNAKKYSKASDMPVEIKKILKAAKK